MEELLRELVALQKEMEELTVGSGVPKAQYSYMSELKGDILVKELQARVDWLFSIRHKEYHGVLEIWRLVKPEVWKRYESYGFHNLREQKLLRERRMVLRKAWKKWYRENCDEETITVSKNSTTVSDGLSVRSESTKPNVDHRKSKRRVVLRNESHRADHGSEGSGDGASGRVSPENNAGIFTLDTREDN
jgi:Ser-tRNA(Ala) deacylase AlaX